MEAISTEISPRYVPPPRLVRRKRGHNRTSWLVRIFILPHTLVGIGAILYAVFISTMVLLNTTTTGEVFDRWTGSDDDGTTYHVGYSYRYNGAEYASSDRVSYSEYAGAKPGDRVSILLHPLMPGLGARLLSATGPWDILFAWVFALFWNAVLGVFYWMLYIQPARLKHLISCGEVTDGWLTGKSITQGNRSQRYVLTYEFMPTRSTPEASEEKVSGKMFVDHDDYESASIGARVDVVYAPDRPRRNVIYQYSPFAVVGASALAPV